MTTTLPTRAETADVLPCLTTRTVAVDLAARFSACVVLDEFGDVAEQWDSGRMGPREVAEAIRATVDGQTVAGVPPLTVIEDLPHHLPASSIIKSVAQLQGRINQALTVAQLERTFYVPPAYWEQAMGVFRQDHDVWAARAAERGYTAPDLLAARGLVPGTRGQATAVKEALKQQTDYVAAYLIAAWAQQCMATNQHWDLKIVKQYAA